MPTGACGINCDVCRLNLLGLCSSCGAGKSREARLKLNTQERLLGGTCSILNCVIMNNKNYCMRDCSQFPCENFELNPYPFSQAYLDMQKRRRAAPTLQMDPLGKTVSVPDEFWDEICKREINLICSCTLTEADDRGNIIFNFLGRDLVLDMGSRYIREKEDDMGQAIENPLHELICLTYFKNIDRLYPLGRELISSKDMKQSVYFQGENQLRKEPVLRRFANDFYGFFQSAEALGGERVELADAAVVLYPFPRVPVYYLLWEGQGDYDARITLLFDRSIQEFFDPPIIWGLVNLVNSYFLTV